MIRLENLLDSWKTIREDTAATVDDVPQAAFDARPIPDLMTFRELARHVLNSSQAVSGMLLDGWEDFSTADTRPKMRDYFPPEPSDEELAGALRSVFEARLAQLKAQTPEWFAHLVTRFDGQKLTRLEFIQMMKEHELTHRSQMFIVARMQGVVPVTTRRRQQLLKK